MSKEIEDIFSDEMENEIKKEVRKKRKWLYVKVIAITSIVLSMIIGIVAYSLINLDEKKYSHMISINKDVDFVYFRKYPNTFIGELKVERNGMFDYDESYTMYKKIGGKSIFLGEHRFKNNHAIRNGNIDGYYNDFNTIFNEDINKRVCNIYGVRPLYFLYPDVDYGRIINDIKFLDEISENKIIEMVLCFDKEYSYKDINNILDKSLITFYWTNETASNMIDENDDKPFTNEEFVTGVKSIDNYGNRIENPVERYSKNFGIEYTEENLYSKGVVVVGTKEELSRLENNPMIKHSVIGNVVDKY